MQVNLEIFGGAYIGLYTIKLITEKSKVAPIFAVLSAILLGIGANQ